MNSKCEKVLAKVYPYLDREIGLFRKLWVRWHLWRCPPCADGFVFEDRFKERVKKGCIEEVPEELLDRMRTFISQQEPDSTGAG